MKTHIRWERVELMIKIDFIADLVQSDSGVCLENSGYTSNLPLGGWHLVTTPLPGCEWINVTVSRPGIRIM